MASRLLRREAVAAVGNPFEQEEAVIIASRRCDDLAGLIDQLDIEPFEAAAVAWTSIPSISPGPDQADFDLAATPGRGTITCNAFLGASDGSLRLVVSIPTAIGWNGCSPPTRTTPCLSVGCSETRWPVVTVAPASHGSEASRTPLSLLSR